MLESQKEKLLSLDVDLDETLERFVGNENLFFKCLNRFLEDTNYHQLLAAIDIKDAKVAFEAAHALKGVSANLGLTYLYEEIRVITEVFRAGSLDFEPENMERLKAAYANVITVIDSL